MQHCIPVSSSILLAVLAGCATPTLAPLDNQATLSEPYTTAAEAPAPAAAAATPAPLPQDRERNMPRKGNVEVLLAGSGGNDEDFEAGSGAASLGLGYYLTDGLELVARQSGSFADPGPGSDAWSGVSRAGLDFNFVFAPLVPYVGGTIGYIYGDGVHDSWIAGPEAGLKWYIKDEAFLQASVEYAFFFDNEDTVGDAFDDGTFLYSLGFGLRF